MACVENMLTRASKLAGGIWAVDDGSVDAPLAEASLAADSFAVDSFAADSFAAAGSSPGSAAAVCCASDFNVSSNDAFSALTSYFQSSSA